MTELLARAAGPQTLDALTDLLARLHAEEIAYCHWKSNEHLEAALAGRTDLDLLVARRAAPRFARILEEHGFKRFLAAPARRYPGVEDHLGLDRRTGALIHLHVHYQLTLGEKYLKGYRLPWEDRVLAARRLDASGAIYVADPHHELLLLMVRAALKLRTRDVLRAALGRPAVPESVLRELRWLAARVRPDTLAEAARPLVGERATTLLLDIVADGPTARSLLALRRSAVPSLARYRSYGALEARRRRWALELHAHLARAERRVLGWWSPTRRTRPQGGLVVAFVGPDGAGKSTLTRAVADWLAWKADVLRVYLGTGDGAASRARRAWVRARTLLARPRAPDGARVGGDRPARYTRVARLSPATVWRLWFALGRARRTLAQLARLRRAADRGAFVVCDRFPQQQFAGLNDGPLLGDWRDHGSAILRAAARRERAAFDAMAAHAPDLVVKLRVDPEVARLRRPEMTQARLKAKADAVAATAFPVGTRVVEIDASQPLERVLLQVKHAIWECL